MPAAPRILDAGCGTGEGASRLAELFPLAHVLGVDIVDPHLELARARYASLAPHLTFEHQSIFELEAADRSFDLTVCRHVLHSIPHADRVIAELARVTRRGGYLHLIPEDYGMLHFQRASLDPLDFWHQVAPSFEKGTGTDLFIGRHAFGILAAMKLEEIKVDYVVVDNAAGPARNFRGDPGSLARRIRRLDRRANANLKRIRRGVLQSDDRQHPRPPRLRCLDGSGR